MSCKLKHLQRCDTCFNSVRHGCYGYDQGYDCYENIFDKYFELEKKFNIVKKSLLDSDDKLSSAQICDHFELGKKCIVGLDKRCGQCNYKSVAGFR